MMQRQHAAPVLTLQRKRTSFEFYLPTVLTLTVNQYCTILVGQQRKQLRLNLLLRRNKCSVISLANKINKYEMYS
jgi:hypothetical protein